jgi:nitrite reductase/ring-hydroxylating ferredoxin subunit
MRDGQRIAVRSERREDMTPVADHWRRDDRPPPERLFDRGERDDLGTRPVPKEQFTSRAQHELEVERLWKRVWQMACREQEVAAPGDYMTYEIADQSVVVVREDAATLRAFHNVCLHRGTRLVEGRGSLGSAACFQCTFHAWRWHADGSLAGIPCRWDFPEVRDEDYALRPVQVDTWDGWVFVNLDPDAPPLRDFLGEAITAHFELWPHRDRFKAVHVGKVQPANWKIVTEAFIETYHVIGTHPDTLPYAYDAAARYDQYGPHVARMVQLIGATSPHLPDDTYTEQDIVDAVIGQATQLSALTEDDARIPRVPEGGTARPVLSAYSRRQLAADLGIDLAGASDAEILDVLEYYVFPNFVPWGGFAYPIVNRYRPAGDRHEACFMEVMLLVPFVGDRPPDAELIVLPEGAKWSDAPELGGLGPVLDQDDGNIRKMQLGLHSDGITGVSLSQYQEGNLRLLHRTLADYLARD